MEFLIHLLKRIENKIKLLIKPDEKTTLVRRLCKHLESNLHYKDITVERTEDQISIIANKFNEKTLILIDYAKRIMQDITDEILNYNGEKINFRTIFTKFLNGKTQSLKDITTGCTNGKPYEITRFRNYITGNTYKREKTHEGVTYYKRLNDGTYMNLFPKH